MIMNLI